MTRTYGNWPVSSKQSNKAYFPKLDKISRWFDIFQNIFGPDYKEGPTI